MKKLQRVQETAEEEGRSVEDVARERYDTLEAFEEAKEERRVLDERSSRRGGSYGGGRGDGGGAGAPGGGRAPLPEGRSMDAPSSSSGSGSGGEKRWMFTDVGNPESRPSSRNSFRRPGASSDSAPGTPEPSKRPAPPQTPDMGGGPVANKRIDALRGRPSFGTNTGTSSPIPSAFTPTAILAQRSSPAGKKRALSPSSLNKLQAKVLKAKLMGSANAAELEKQFDEERKRAEAGGDDGEDDDEGGSSKATGRVEMLPTVDGMGRLYDIGSGKNDPRQEVRPGNRKPKEKVRRAVPRPIIRNADCLPSSSSTSKPETAKPAKSFVSTPTTIPPPWATCSGKSASVAGWLIRKTWMLNLPEPSRRTSNSRTIWSIWTIMLIGWDGRRCGLML